jgi:hypothetical protein
MSFGPPLVNFSTLGNLGTTFTTAYDKAAGEADARNAASMFAGLLQPSSPNLAQGLIQTQDALNQGQQGVGAGVSGSGKKTSYNELGTIPSFIQAAADQTGASPAYLTKTAQIESNMNPAAHNKSGADGLFQFVPSTAAQYGVDTSDPMSSAVGAGKLAVANANVLRSRLGRDPTDGETYLAHQQGAGGASYILANPDMPVSAAPGKLQQNILANGGDPSMTLGQFAQKWTGRFDSPQGGARVAQAQPAPLPPSRPQGVQVASADPNFAPQMPQQGGQPSPSQYLVAQAQQRRGGFPSPANAQSSPGGPPDADGADEEDPTDAATETTGSTKLADASKKADYTAGQVVFKGLPQQGPSGPLPTSTGLDRLTPQQKGLLANMLQNPATRAQAMQSIQGLMQPVKPEMKEIGGRLYAIDPVTQQASPIKGVGEQWVQYVDDAGNQMLRNKDTQQTMVLEPSQKAVYDKGEEYDLLANARAKRAAAMGMQPGTTEYNAFVGSGKVLAGRQQTPQQQADERTQLAISRGIDPDSPEGQQFVLNGKLPDPAQIGQMKGNEQKVYEAEDQKQQILKQQIEDLNKARQLNPQVYSGNYEPGAARFIARNVPLLGSAIVDPDRVTATTQYENLVGGATLSQGKELFGSRVTNYDEKLMQQLKANPNLLPAEREAILGEMVAHRQRTLEESQQRAQQMKQGSYFKRGNGQQPAAQPAAPAGPSRGIPDGAIQMLKSNPALAPQFEQKYGPGSARGILSGG